jgi:hypothetical protein
MGTRDWCYIEVGGSGSQTAVRGPSGDFAFSAGVAPIPGRQIALACPGVVAGGRVRYATNLGWPADADPGLALGIGPIALVANDAVAAALGESALRAGDAPAVALRYVALGTGVGSARVDGGVARDLDLGHRPMGGTRRCAGCGAVGCLDTLLAARWLPPMLGPDDLACIARTLAAALRATEHGTGTPLVLGGGIARRYPMLVALLAARRPYPVWPSRAPAAAKSAAYAGLEVLARRRAAPPAPGRSPCPT